MNKRRNTTGLRAVKKSKRARLKRHPRCHRCKQPIEDLVFSVGVAHTRIVHRGCITLDEITPRGARWQVVRQDIHRVLQPLVHWFEDERDVEDLVQEFWFDNLTITVGFEVLRKLGRRVRRQKTPNLSILAMVRRAEKMLCEFL